MFKKKILLLLLCCLIFSNKASFAQQSINSDLLNEKIHICIGPETRNFNSKDERDVANLIETAQRHYRFEGKNFPKMTIIPNCTRKNCGDMIASAYAQYLPFRNFINRVIILSNNSNKKKFGLILSDAKEWQIGKNKILVDVSMNNKLKEIQGIGFDEADHLGNYNLEAQIPFILKTFTNNIKIVPILAGEIGDDQLHDLMDFFWDDPGTIFITVMNLSSSEKLKTAQENSDKLARIIRKMENASINKNLSNSPELISGILSYLRNNAAEVEQLDYKILEPDIFSDNNEYFGAAIFSIYKTNTDSEKIRIQFEKSVNENKNLLLKLAGRSIKSGIRNGRQIYPRASEFPPELSQKGASVITLHTNGQLRGAYSSTSAKRSLLEDIALNAYNAGFNDYRFDAISQNELKDTEITLSVLTEPLLMQYESEKDVIKQLRPGVDGVYLRERKNKSTFLPQVWEAFATPEEFLKKLKHAAGLPEDYWSPTIKIYHFEMLTFYSGDLENPQSIWE
ncbi:MAG: AmmeMemoRadiSam system protein A [Alphaproteobacteria bacterium]|nr:AmmeMemoRadiSam system protein A [Alphaproteobacteria bacterium]